MAAAPAAGAAPKSVSSFFPSSTGNGSLGGQLNTPRGVAVNSSGAGSADAGDIYVADSNNNRIQVFDSIGAFKFAIGRDVVKPGSTGNIPNNEVQTVTVSGATGGTFLLTYQGTTGSSAPVPYNATAAEFQAALEESPSLGAGSVSVTGPAGGPWTVEFVGAFADSDVSQLVGSAGPGINKVTNAPYGLTPSGTVTIATLTEGAKSAEKCTVAADCKVGVTGGPGGAFSGPQGIAVDQSTGDFYVSDQSNIRVEKHAADGTFLRAWGKDVSISDPSGFGEVCTVAADCKVGVTGGTTLARGGEFSSTFAGHLAVAPAGAPNAGNVVVADPANRRVQEFDPNGAFVRAWGFDVVVGGVTTFEICTVKTECKTAATTGAGLGQFTTNQPTRVAVDATGATYTVESATANFRVQKFTAALAPSVFAAATLSGTATTNTPTDVAINTAGNVLVVKAFPVGAGSPPATVAERRVLELDSAGTLVETHAALAGLGVVNGLAADLASDTLYLSSTTGGSRIYALRPVTPASGSLGVSAITAHTAVLSGVANANGPSVPFAVRTSFRVEISEDGTTWSTVGPEVDIGQGTGGIAKSLSGLKADTLYQSRLVLNKQFSPPAIVTGPSFATTASRPDVEALSPTEKGDATATLNARVNANGQATTYRIEYGETVAYGTSVPVPDGAAGAAKTPVVLSQPVSGLEPRTTYHLRVVATNASGTAKSADRTFTTRAALEPPDGRAYEMVSRPDKVGGVGVGFWAAGPGHIAATGIPAYTGERFAVASAYGAPLNGDSAYGYTNDWFFAERDGDQLGWRSHSPITHTNYQPGIGQYVALAAASENLSRVYMPSGNFTPTIFPEMGVDHEWIETNLGYFLDWGSQTQPSRWELFGPQGLDQLVEPQSKNTPWQLAFSADGRALVAQTEVDTKVPARGAIFGLDGAGDPTWPAFGDLAAGRSIYLADTSGPPADTFAGTSQRDLVNVCTGAGGIDRTELPAVASELLGGAECPAPNPGRDSHLLSDHGAALSPTANPSEAALGDVISADGSRIFFMSPDPVAAGVPDVGCSGTGPAALCPPQLYVRQRNADGSVTTRWISRAEPSLFGVQNASLTAGVRFEGSTPDGERVFFRTTSPLTEDDPNGLDAPIPGGVRTGQPSAQSSDLYMYEFPVDPNADIGDGTLTRISAGPEGNGDCNSPLSASGSGTVNSRAAALRFASDDGRRVYFTCTAPLPGVPDAGDASLTSQGGNVATSDQTNLYLYDEHLPLAERWRFVTRLPRAAAVSPSSPQVTCASTGAKRLGPFAVDNGFVAADLGESPGQSNCVGGTSDGAFITFFTNARLLADDPAGPLTGDIYAYDAEADQLDRLAAPQGGSGGTYLCAPYKGISTTLCHADGGADAAGAVHPNQGGVTNPILGMVTDPETPGDRIAFFESRASLVPEDEDGSYDVYQWKNGDLSLITPGAPDSQHAMYRGNSADGRNVYFVTLDSLTWQDYDAVNDVYTARVDGGIAEPVLPPACDVLAGACEGTTAPAPAAPSQAASAVLAGEGNVAEKTPKPKRCGKNKVRRGGKCVKKHGRGSGKQRAASKTGRAGR